MSAVPSQNRGVLERYGLSQADADRAAWTVGPDGAHHEGMHAINRALRACGGVLPLLGYLGQTVPPLAWVETRLYGWVAAHRRLVSRVYSTTPACEEPGADCVCW